MSRSPRKNGRGCWSAEASSTRRDRRGTGALFPEPSGSQRAGGRGARNRGKAPSIANRAGMGVIATATLLADAVDQAQTFVHVFVIIYTLVILAYLVTSWLRLPYSPWLNRIQRFLYDVSE